MKSSAKVKPKSSKKAAAKSDTAQRAARLQETFAAELAANQPSSLHEVEYLFCAWTEASRHMPTPLLDEERGITRTGVFHLVRLAKGHPKLIALSAEDALDWLRTMMENAATDGQSWAEGDQWESDFGIPADEAIAEFLDAWARVRVPIGWDMIDLAVELAHTAPLTVENAPSKLHRLFLSVAYHLQIMRGFSPIALPEALLARKLGVSQITISRVRRWAEANGFLGMVERHKFRPGQSGVATQFKFILEHVAIERPSMHRMLNFDDFLSYEDGYRGPNA
jgi:hypothetical protein